MRKELAQLEHVITTEALPIEYIMKSSVEIVDTQKILFISFFTQKKEKNKDKADFKLFIWDNKYMTQKLETDGSYIWSQARIEYLLGWYSWSYKTTAGCYTLHEREIIAEFLKIECKDVGDELRAIDKFQKKIMQEKLNVKHEKIKKKIDEYMSKVSPLPEDFESWIHDGPFEFSRYIYYKREGRKIVSYCTECKKDFAIIETEATKKGIKHNEKGICPKCNKKITYKAVGKSKNILDKAYFAIMQKYEDGFIVRYFSGTKTYREHYKSPSLSYHEYIREIFYFNKKILGEKRFEYGNFHQTGDHRWCNDASKIETPKAYFYSKNLKSILEGTKWEYSCLQEFADNVKHLYVDTFLAEYLKYPAIEYLIKFKLYNFTNDKLSGYYYPNWSGVNFKGKNIEELLGVDKEVFRQMQRLNLGTSGLQLIKDAAFIQKKANALTDEQVIWIMDNVQSLDFIKMLDYSTPTKIINYVKKQSNKKYSLSNVMSDWRDYIRQCKDLKFDVKNTFILYPKNLKEKHEEYSIMNKAKGLKKYNSNVKKTFEKLDQSYSYLDKKFLIRPANSVDEIVAEGHKLRHCVGGSYYIGAVAKGESAIMLVRKIDDPEQSFFTLELSLKTLHVSQCRGYKNSDMTTEVRKFIDKWKAQKLTIERKKAV